VATYAIPDPVDFTGEWYLPGGQSAPHIAGSLSWKEERATLALHESFTKVRGVIYGTEEFDYPAIFGTTTKSELVSVLHAYRSGSGFSLGAAGMREPETVTSSWIVVGAHVTQDTKYDDLRVRIPGLQMWISRGGVTQSMIHKTAEKPFTVLYAVEGMPEEFTPIPMAGLSLGWGIDRQFSGDLVSTINVESSACLRIKPDEAQTLEWLIAEMGKAVTLLALLAGAPMAPDQMTAKLADVEREVTVLVGLRESAHCTHKRAFDFFMLRGDMHANLGEVFARWYTVYDNVAMPSQLALGVLSSKGLWLHVEFLSLMQALEGLHRAIMPGLYVSEAEYAPVAHALTHAIPSETQSDHKDSLKARIRYGNQLSLRKRLDALVDRLDLPIRQFILGGVGAVPRTWIDTRNYYTHWDETLRPNTLDGIAMHRACARMKTLLRVLYLQLVGVPDEAVLKSLTGGCSESQYLIQLNTSEHRKRHPGSEAGAMMRIDVKDAQSPDPSSA
jgi:hypothetical protein